MQRYSIEPTTRKHFKGYGFLSLKKIQKKKMDTGLNVLKYCFQKRSS